MLVESFAPFLASYSITSVLVTALLACILQLIWTWNQLRHIPGPVPANFTDLWRLLVVWKRDSHDTYLRLHKQYGDFVRIGPNCISVSRPDVIPTIYGIGVKAVKSDFYSVWQNIVNGKRTASLVFTTDEAQHSLMKRPIANAYSLSTLVEFEPLIDSTTAVFLSRLDELFADKNMTCDLGTWIQWYAFDVIGELSLSKRLGFLERAEDVEGITASVAANFDRCSVLGQMPWLDQLTYKNPIYHKLFARGVMNPIISFGQRRLQERLDGKSEAVEQFADVGDPALSAKVLHDILPSKADFLSRFLKLHDEQPDIVTDRALLAYLFMNINAGSDTISSTLKAIVYHLLKFPATMAALCIELQDAKLNNILSTPLPTWSECQQLRYLNACIKEGLRLNPALSLPLERITPPQGFQIGDTFIPPGTIIGVNAWVLQRDTRIFGADAEIWRPERWLIDDVDKIKRMDQHILAFGAGKRTCLGRNIAMLELMKLIPALVWRYEMELERPEEQWRIINAWAVRQEGLDVRLRRRERR